MHYTACSLGISITMDLVRCILRPPKRHEVCEGSETYYLVIGRLNCLKSDITAVIDSWQPFTRTHWFITLCVRMEVEQWSTDIGSELWRVISTLPRGHFDKKGIISSSLTFSAASTLSWGIISICSNNSSSLFSMFVSIWSVLQKTIIQLNLDTSAIK